jgi:hypothetical protein
MASERIAPDALLVATTLSGSVSAIQDDPDSPDASWLVYDGATNGNSDCRVSFPTPANPPSTGAGLQEFRAQLRKNASGGNSTTWSLALWENGAQVAVLATGTTTALAPNGEVVTGAFDASLLGTSDGSLVECRLEQTGGGSSGSGGNRRRIEIGAIEWNAETAVAGRTGSGATSAPAQVSAGGGTVSVAGPGATTAGGQLAAGSGTVAVSGSGATTAPAQQAAGTGSLESDGRTGSGATTAAAQTASGAGSVAVTGSGATSAAPQAAAATGSVAASGAGATTAGGQLAAGTGAVTAAGSGATVAPAQVSSGWSAEPSQSGPPLGSQAIWRRIGHIRR